MKQNPKQRILYIDAEEPKNVELVEQLTHRGYVVNRQSDIRFGLRELKLFLPELVLVDLYNYSDKLTVEAFMKEVRAKTPRVPVVVLTGYADIHNAIECKKCGVADFVSKPWDFVDLEVTLERVLSDAYPGRKAK